MLLNRLVTAILTDIAAAQDAANVYSSQLSFKYKQYADDENNPLSSFSVPNGLLKEIELDLKFIINNLETPLDNLDMESINEICHVVADRSVKKAVAQLTAYVKDNTKLAGQDIKNNWNKVIENVNKKRFINFLKSRVTRVLVQQSNRLFRENINPKDINKLVNDTLDNTLLEHPDIKELLSKEADQELRKKFDEITNQLFTDEELETLVKEVKSDVCSSVDVIVAQNILRDLPKDAISSIRIKAELSNYQWTISEASESLQQVH